MGLRVWKATTFLHASFLKCERSSEGVSSDNVVVSE